MFKCFFNETAEEECQFLRSTSYNKVLVKDRKLFDLSMTERQTKFVGVSWIYLCKINLQ